MSNRVLIVEDSAINRNILSKMLEDEYDILQACNGKEALDMIKEQYADISAIILDLLMPVMNGKELLTILSADDKYSNLPVLIATGEHNDALESECLELGAWDFVTKPYNPIVIRLRLHNIIGRSQTHLMHRIQMLAERDSLTGLYNRGFFMKSTARMLRENPQETFVLIRMDIDQFRLYNSSFGSEAGDELLKNIANGIVKKLSKTDREIRTYGRIESDVFCICKPYESEKIQEELLLMEQEIQGFCSTYRLKVSFGLYVIEDNTMEMESMYANTVEASRKCKYDLNRFYAYYGSEMGKKIAREQLLTNEMNKAIAEEQFHVYLQPKYSMETNRPCGAEALVRWIHPEWGMVSPGEFIPVFEQNGLIVQLDYYMWEHVCVLLQKWINAGKTVFPVSVNISRISMYNPQIVKQLVNLTEKYEIPRLLLNLEITESAYMSNPDLMKDIIEDLRKEGFVILMDDFGSGYSSLNTLKDIDVDILKIDMKFLPTGHNNAKSEKILASINRMAGWLGMPVIVEGVETREQKEFLESIGCCYVQGFFYARPMPVDAYERLLQELPELTQESTRELLGDFDALWSSDSETGTLLKSVSVPFAIFEYGGAKMDILRMNQVFSTEFFGNDLGRFLLPEEWQKLNDALSEVVYSKKIKDCECLFVLANGESKWYQIRLQHIGTVEKTSLVSATFLDVSLQRNLEQEINSVFSALKDKQTKKKTLLVVDDLEVSRAVLKSLFEEEYEVLTACDGREGLEILKENYAKIAAILLDMMMPVMNGQEFLSCKNQMKNAADIPVIVISTESSAEMQINMLKNGVNDYVTKPFVPALVRKRLQNVIEYSSRFRTLVQEYQEINTITEPGRRSLNLSGYTLDEVRRLIFLLSEVFDLVRLVDPRDTAVVTIQPNGTLTRVPYSCFSVWGKNVRCENCSSMCAMKGQCSLNKFELLKKDVFYVVSQPVKIQVEGDETENLVLEIASKIEDKPDADTEESAEFRSLLQKSHSLIYTDPLTKCYNRRFFDEMLFMHHGQNAVAESLALIMMDLNKFKQINDLFGHQNGDRVLREVVAALQGEIRQNDSLIRYGGDEFVIILTNCAKEQIAVFIERFKNAVQRVKYGTGDRAYVEAEFGEAYTNQFNQSDEMLNALLKEADQKMYERKRDRECDRK